MITYCRPADLGEALGLLAAGATPLAGGQSLVPELKAGRRPATLADIGRLGELAYVLDRGDHLAIGAATTHHDLAGDAILAGRAPALQAAAAAIADPQIRHMGTIGGSLAHADPAADLAVAGVALDASVVVRSVRGSRVLALGSLATGRGRTGLLADELITEIRVPVPAAAWSYQKFHRDALEWAVVGVVAVGGDRPRVALSGMGPTVLRATAVEKALAAGASAAQAAELAAHGTAPAADVRASREYRRHLAKVLVRRALEEIAA